MDARRQRLVQRRGWDRAVAHYERYWAQQLAPAQELLLHRAELTAGERVLDVACGTGLVTLAAAASAAGTGCVIATDLSPAMVATTLAHAERAGLTNVRGVTCGAEELTIDGPFDVALCSLGLMYVPEPARAISELYRVLRPGGRIVVSVWGQRHRCGWAGVFGVVDSRVSSDVCPLFFGLGSPGALAHQLEAAGFDDVDSEPLSVELEYLDDDEAVGAAFLGGPVALAYARFDPAARAGAEREYLDSIADFRTPGGSYRVPGQFVIAWARKPLRGPQSITNKGAIT